MAPLPLNSEETGRRTRRLLPLFHRLEEGGPGRAGEGPGRGGAFLLMIPLTPARAGYVFSRSADL